MRVEGVGAPLHRRRSRASAISPLTWVKDRWPAITLVAILLLSIIGLSPIALVGLDPSSSAMPTGDGDALKQASFILIFLLIAFYVGATRGIGRLLDIPMPFIVVLAWCWLSLLWAVDPGIALRRVILTTLLIVSLTYAVRAMPVRTVLKVVTGTFAVVLLADWASIALFKNAVQQATELEKELAGDWRGLHSHKNEAGAFCAMALIVFCSAAYRARSRITGPVVVLAALAFLWLTQSKTSVGFVFVAMLVGAMSDVCYNNPSLRKIALVVVLCILWSVVEFDALPYDLIYATIDDPTSFTGRTGIWAALAEYASDHFLFGSGFGSFWSIGADSPIYAYRNDWVTTVYEAHNGYLDIQVQIGFVGLVLVLSLLVIRPLYILFCLPLRLGASRWLLCSTLAFGLLHELLESSLLNRTSPSWVIMVLMYVLLEDARLPRRKAQV